MKNLGIIVGLMMIVTCYAYKVINTENFLKEAQLSLTQESLKLQDTIDARLPARSKVNAGEITPHKVKHIEFSNPIFIIGDDPFSRKWLKQHAQELQKIKAIGFITNIDSQKNLKEIQAIADLPLLPANVDDLLTLIEVNHYPLAIYQGEVWQ